MIHLNGTSSESLLAAIENAFHAVTAAKTALAATAPNGRDYYLTANVSATKSAFKNYATVGAAAKARDDHNARMMMLNAVNTELEAIAAAIHDRETTTTVDHAVTINDKL